MIRWTRFGWRSSMSRLGDVVMKVRSKNAGPFWITVDIFCGTGDAYVQVCQGLSTERIGSLLKTEPKDIKRFDIPSLNVVKLSLPRPTIQGAKDDRDMHGAALATLIAELELN